MCSEVRKNPFMYICGKQMSHVIRTDYFLTERWLFFFNLKNENVQFLTLIGMSYESKKNAHL